MMKNDRLTHIGNRDLLKRPLIAFFCSQQCPGEIIIKAQDWANQAVGDSHTIISGFHTPVEKEVLRILLRGKHPAIMCMARGLENYRVPVDLKPGIADGTLLLVSPFPASERRVTSDLAEKRNRHILTMVDTVLIAHAAPGGKTFDLATATKERGLKLLSFASNYNEHLQIKDGLQTVSLS